MIELHSAGFVLRPFATQDAPAFAAAVRESMATVGQWMSWAQHQGAATAAVAALARHAFDELKQSRVEIVVAEGNASSIGVARKAGAVHECLARNRLRLHGKPVAAHVFALLPPEK